MDILKSTIFVVFTALFFNSCKNEPKKIIKSEPIAFKNEGVLTIRKQKVDTLITTLNIEIAESEYETQTGLMYRNGMEDAQGMLFVFENEQIRNFHMKNTEFPLDIIFIKKNLEIAGFQENAQPFNEELLSSQIPVQYVLEINEGLAEKWLLEVGDKIEFYKN